jgi:cation diffusion facilitator family transporter
MPYKDTFYGILAPLLICIPSERADMPDSIQASDLAANKLQNAAQQKLRLQMILFSLAVSAGLMGVKFLIYHLTQSSAVLSDALESIINVAAGAFATLSVWMSAKPPDLEHPYGHGKIEYFSAGFEGALIMVAAAGIFYTGIHRLRYPQVLPNLGEGLAILCVATGVNLLLGICLLRIGRRTDSITLTADGKHILTDVYTSGGVLIGLVLVLLTGQLWLDGAVACLVGINILITGGQLLRQSFARLMDASDPLLLNRITEVLERHRRPEWIDIHQLRAWQAGYLIHVDLHLVLPKDLSMDCGHREAKAVEILLFRHFKGNASVLVHMDPCEANQCPICQKNECEWRSSRFVSGAAWTKDHLVRSLSEDRTIESRKNEH